MFLLQNICLILHSNLLVCPEPCTKAFYQRLPSALMAVSCCPDLLFGISGQLGKAYGSSGIRVGTLHSQAVLQ